MLYFTYALISKKSAKFCYSNDFIEGSIKFETPAELYQLLTYLPKVLLLPETLKIETGISKIQRKNGIYIIAFCTEVPCRIFTSLNKIILEEPQEIINVLIEKLRIIVEKYKVK